MEFGVLGPLEVTARGQPLLVRGARTRAVLAMLLMHANQVVPADQLIDELWPGQPADRASASLQVRMSELRTALRSAQEAERLVTQAPGYLIRLAPGELDALRFDQLVRHGETALATGAAGLAAQRLAEALSLWRGPALADVASAPFAHAEAARLEERRIAALESRAEALRAVMRACGSDRATLFGYSEGGPMSILFAATYPERVTSLILGAAVARWPAAPDYPCGQRTEEMSSALEELAVHRWGQGDSIDWYAPSLAGSDAARRALARWERLAASPSAVLRMIRMIRMIRTVDVHGILPEVSAPALIIQRRHDRITPPCHGRYLAAQLPAACYFEQPGDHLLWLGDTEAMVSRIQEFLVLI